VGRNGNDGLPGDGRPIGDWASVPWRKLETTVYRLQKRIFQASCRGDVAAVRSVQRLVMKSEAARCLAVRRVTQDNQGKHTAGIDGVASVPPGQRWLMVDRLRHPETIKPRPVRRVWIPKPGKAEKRPLGIPVMLDRALQALAKLALEPEWEARFEPNSYGFRPARSAHDAIAAIFDATCKKDKYVLDADIAGCFDNIAHEPLLAKLATFPRLRHLIKGWLTAGVMEGTALETTWRGSPQGGVISPLLALIALHGLETAITSSFGSRDRPQVVVYADDFVVLHPTRAGVEKAQRIAEDWLNGMGLRLKASKTRITHTRLALEGPAGFEFLGFHIRRHVTHEYRPGGDGRKQPVVKTLIKPSKDAIKRHHRAMRDIVRARKAAPHEALISALNPVIRGWSMYYRTVVAKKVFASCDYRLFSTLLHWAGRRHPKKSAGWVFAKYWRRRDQGRLEFATPDGPRLAVHADIPIKRHVKVRGHASPFDGNLVYWATRLRDHPLTTSRTAILLRRQRGKCTHCRLLFTDADTITVTQFTPPQGNGLTDLARMRALHHHCRDKVNDQAESTTQAQVAEVFTTRTT
jgi:RNA-directed DNA polymerase